MTKNDKRSRILIKRLRGWSARWISAFGFDPFTAVKAVRGVIPAIRDYINFRAGNNLSHNKYKIRFSYPRFADRYKSAGVITGHYFHQDLLVAQKVFERNPATHVDIGSRVDGFVAHVAAFRPIIVFDIRPLESKTPNIIFRQLDLLQPVHEYVSYCDSLSCLHALEHFGLGRYGDPIQVDGHLIAFERLAEILKPGGILYLSVPIGPQRIEFNAHRIFAIQTMLNLFENRFQLLNFSYVDDSGDLHYDIRLTPDLIARQCDCVYGLGIFELQKNVCS